MPTSPFAMSAYYWFFIYSQGPYAVQPDDPGIDFEGRPVSRDLSITAIVLGAGAVLFILFLLIAGV